MQLWKHQEKAIEFAQTNDVAALFFDPGTGKTFTTIRILEQKFMQHGGPFFTLIFCPQVVVGNWVSEFKKFSRIHTPTIALIGSQTARVKKVLESDSNSVFITNYEALLMDDLLEALSKKFMSPGAIVFDESHRIKDIKAKRTKVAIDVADSFKYRFILTGTPVLRNEMDLFTQFRALSGDIFGSNFFVFRSRFFRDKNAGMPSHKHFPDFVLREGAEEEIKKIVDRHALFAKKESCLDLPPLTKIKIPFSLSVDQRRLYTSMKNNFVAMLTDESGNNQVSFAELVITKSLRMQQIVSGHLRVQKDDGTVATYAIRDNPRKGALKELLSDLAPRNKVIVWAIFKDNYKDIREVCDALDLKYVELTGETVDKDAAIKEFNEGEASVLIGNQCAGGIGVNLTAASYMIYYTRSFSLEHDIQSEARNYRGGSEIHKSITRYDIVATDTIDELVLEALAKKQEISDKILKENVGRL